MPEPETDGIALGESACRAVDVRHDFVDDRGGELWVDASPVGMEKSSCHISTGGMPHTLV